MARDPISRSRDGGVELRLPANARDVIRQVASELRALYAAGVAEDDPGVARLFPTPYLDDPLGSLAFDEKIAASLREGRLEAIALVERTAGSRHLSVEEADAWIRTLNDARLVLGTRLEITEESTADDFSGDPAGDGTFRLYVFLSGIVDALVRVLAGDA